LKNIGAADKLKRQTKQEIIPTDRPQYIGQKRFGGRRLHDKQNTRASVNKHRVIAV
jgi:hypothetical protein